MGSTDSECFFWRPGLAAGASVFLPASHVNAACLEHVFNRPQVCLARGQDLVLERVPCCQQVNAACPERGRTGLARVFLAAWTDCWSGRARAAALAVNLPAAPLNGMALWSGEAGASALTGVLRMAWSLAGVPGISRVIAARL